MAKSITLGWRQPPSDVQEHGVAHKSAGPGGPAPVLPAPTRRRRANPVATLLPATRRWIDGLPPQVRPTLLAAQFGGIANQLCRSWSEPGEGLAYFDELLEDRHGDRAGFPIGVLRELQALRRYFEEWSAQSVAADC